MRSRLTANNIVMALAIVIAAVLIAGFTAVVTTTPVGSTLTPQHNSSIHGCDNTSDADADDDCIGTSVDAFSAGESVEAGKQFSTMVTIAPNLQGRDLIIITQYRTVNADGSTGKWWTHKSTHWHAEENSRSTTKEIIACAPPREGGHHMRTVLLSSSATRKADVKTEATPQAAPAVPATLYRVSTASFKQSTAVTCENSADDETNIEIFNMQNFNELYTLQLARTSTDYTVTMQCPPSIGPAGQNLLVIAATQDGSQRSVCDPDGAQPASITLSAAAIAQTPGCSTTLMCELNIFAENRITGTIYSTTVIEVSFSKIGSGAAEEYIPELNPATLPICDNTLNPCLVEGTCTLSTEKTGALSLCESSTSCTLPPNSPYSVDSNVYFQTALKKTVS